MPGSASNSGVLWIQLVRVVIHDTQMTAVALRDFAAARLHLKP